MSELADRIHNDWKNALKEKDTARAKVLSSLRSELKYTEINKGSELTDEDVVQIVQRSVKKHRESIEQFKAGGRGDLVQQEEFELRILEEYLPAQLSEDELIAIIKETIESVGAQTKADMGRVMREVMPKVKGRADGKVVNQLVLKLLG